MYKKGYIIIPNSESWLSFQADYYETKLFPTDKEVEEMKNSLLEKYKETLKLLKLSPLVEKVDVKAGFVLNMEY